MVGDDHDRLHQLTTDFRQDVEAGNTILIDDGLIELTVQEEITADAISSVTVVNGGELGHEKGRQRAERQASSLPARDREGQRRYPFWYRAGLRFHCSFLCADAPSAIRDDPQPF